MEEVPIIRDFKQQQEHFEQEAARERARRGKEGVPPWLGYNEAEQMKSQILALSADRRNFLMPPPQGAQFELDVESYYATALATMREDPRLEQIRYELVPKLVTEEHFWRNYFYRVSLVKQSSQLASLHSTVPTRPSPPPSSTVPSPGTTDVPKHARAPEAVSAAQPPVAAGGATAGRTTTIPPPSAADDPPPSSVFDRHLMGDNDTAAGDLVAPTAYVGGLFAHSNASGVPGRGTTARDGAAQLDTLDLDAELALELEQQATAEGDAGASCSRRCAHATGPRRPSDGPADATCVHAASYDEAWERELRDAMESSSR